MGGMERNQINLDYMQIMAYMVNRESIKNILEYILYFIFNSRNLLSKACKNQLQRELGKMLLARKQRNQVSVSCIENHPQHRKPQFLVRFVEHIADNVYQIFGDLSSVEIDCLYQVGIFYQVDSLNQVGAIILVHKMALSLVQNFDERKCCFDKARMVDIQTSWRCLLHPF